MAVKDQRIIFLGGGQVGKTCLIRKFLQQNFSEAYNPTVEDSYKTILQSADGACKNIEILDTAGNYEFPAMRELNIRTGNIFILVFALDLLGSVAEVRAIYSHILSIKGSTEKNYRLVLVGNKSDLSMGRVVAPETAAAMANEFHCPYLETSAKTGRNVPELFTRVVEPPKQFSTMHLIPQREVNAMMTRFLKRNSDNPQVDAFNNKDRKNDAPMPKRLSADACRDFYTISRTTGSDENQYKITSIHGNNNNNNNSIHTCNGKGHHSNHDRCVLL